MWIRTRGPAFDTRLWILWNTSADSRHAPGGQSRPAPNFSEGEPSVWP